MIYDLNLMIYDLDLMIYDLDLMILYIVQLISPGRYTRSGRYL